MGGVTAALAELPYQQDSWRLATDISRDVVRGDALVRHATEVDAATLPTGPADAPLFLGVVGEEYGGTASASTTQPAGVDAKPYTVMWGRNARVRIEDSATVAYNDALTLSSATPGAFRTAAGGEIVVARCKKAITAGAVDQFTIADVIPVSGVAAAATFGSAASGSTAAELVTGNLHTTTLTVNTTLPAITGGVAQALRKGLYTLPAGVILIHGSHMSLGITQTEGNITADTPDGGLGNVPATGAVATLDGTPTFENVLTGQTFDDCNGTAETIAVTTTLAINAADSHTIYFNVADLWAAGGDAAAALAGTVVLYWSKIA